MQPEEEEKTLEKLLNQLKEKMSSETIFDSTIVLAIIDFFKQEKIARNEILDYLKTSFGGGFIKKLEQIAQNTNPQERIENILSKTLVGGKI